MARRTMLRCALLLGILLAMGATRATAEEPTIAAAAVMGTAISYQGYLTDGGAPADGDYDFVFQLYDGPEAGAAARGATVMLEDITVVGGQFSVAVDVGNAFHGEELWLEVGVRAGSSDSGYTVLAPRTRVMAAPYAHALRWGAGMIGTGVGLIVANDGSVDEPALLAMSNYTAIEGLAFPTGTGVYGGTNNGTGVYGEAFAGTGTGVYASSLSGSAVKARSTSGVALDATGTGIIRSSASSYVFVPATLMQLHAVTSGATLKYWGQGDVTVQASTTGQKQLVLPISVPSVLYGQSVTIADLTLGYLCSGGAEITEVEVYTTTMAGSYGHLDYTGSWSSTSWDDIQMSPMLALSSDRGQVALRIYCDIPAGAGIEFTGVRVELLHD